MKVVQKGSRRIIERGPKRSKKNPTKEDIRERRKKEKDKERRARQKDETDEAYAKRFAMCASKKHFPSREAVMTAAGKNRTGERWKWYKCPYCHGWHLTTH